MLLLVVSLVVATVVCCQRGTVDATTIQETEPMGTEPTIGEELAIQTQGTIEMEPKETEPEYIEKISEVPLYNQLNYYDRYGDSTIKESGCGIVCYAMVLSYLLDREILPNELAAMYHIYKVKDGSSHNLFTDTQDYWGVTLENCYWVEAWLEGKVMTALKNGQPIIANVHADSAFTNGGHFIVLYGLTEDGRILVRDPNGSNYGKNAFLDEGFANGFSPKYFRQLEANYFIYQAKDFEALAKNN